MSAFVVDDKTINGVIAFFYVKSLGNGRYWPNRILAEHGFDVTTEEGRESLGIEMFNLNAKAVNVRYGEDEAKKFRPFDYIYLPVMPLTRMQAFKSLGCWMYQCTEEDVPEMSLYQLMKRVHHHLAVDIVRDLPAWKQAKWG